jgi:ATP-dependent Clp protease ATP-binding subunit ClpA
VVERVVDKMVRELGEQLAEKKVSIKLSKAARGYLAKNGYDPDYGARPLRRLIMREIGDTLTEEILFGELARGGEADIDFKKDKLIFKYTR